MSQWGCGLKPETLNHWAITTFFHGTSCDTKLARRGLSGGERERDRHWQTDSQQLNCNPVVHVPHGQQLHHLATNHLDRQRFLNGNMFNVWHNSFHRHIQTIYFPYLDQCCEHFAGNCATQSGPLTGWLFFIRFSPSFRIRVNIIGQVCTWQMKKFDSGLSLVSILRLKQMENRIKGEQVTNLQN